MTTPSFKCGTAAVALVLASSLAAMRAPLLVTSTAVDVTVHAPARDFCQRGNGGAHAGTRGEGRYRLEYRLFAVMGSSPEQTSRIV
ncbi:hypothetical protein IWX58_004886 [Rubrivivax gelatinosus]|nr:hypothetical protein [Rubrivivax gelatinosus]